ncbi:LysR family transcriptional regulator [Shewanella waksmanii]|uniref:LysR family transcriptional regulator n=1 Tax=Shewanella waksmanii TaxID=213783 RepID=UPI0037356B8D
MKTDDIKLFIQVVDSGSIVRAAALLDLPKSNVSRRIQALETQLGASLFIRQPRALQLTQQGQLFYDNAQLVLQQLDDTMQAIRSPEQQLTGHLKVQMVNSAHGHFITDLLYRFMAQHPKVTIELQSSHQGDTLIERHIDVSFHYGEQLADSELIARKLNTACLGLYASPAFIAENRMPSSIDQLAGLPYVQARMPDGNLLKYPLSEQFNPARLNTVLTCNDVAALVNAAVAGVGIVALPEHLGEALQRQNRLQRLFDDTAVYQLHSWLLYRATRYMPNLKRCFIDYVMDEFEQMDLQGTTLASVSNMVRFS